ncbi:MAG TPA: acetylornithine transaminase [Candidatus Thermoplasmatota archaeon]|nr:acetylornithine transaminase [Candidatus Thermoplasmatota archaeon]
MNLKERWEASYAPNYAAPSIMLDHGKGVEVWDANGKRYLDFLAGIAVSSTGHAHPKVVRAIAEQAGRLMHTSNLYANAPNVALAERLRAATGYDKVFFGNSGAEANEAALKLARRHAHAKGKPEAMVLSLEQSFHGRTTGTVRLTAQAKYQKDFGPLPTQVAHVRANHVGALEKAFAEGPVSALFLEPVQGESGVRPLTASFVQAAAKLCREHDALLVADEIQTGVGRTGKFLALEHFGVKADVTTLAKGIASGMPLGVTLMTERVASLLAPGDHGSTFGGNPVASAAALATLDVLEEERLLENAQTMGAYLRERAQARVPGVKETRGLGLLVGIEFAEPKAKKVKADAEAAGLLVNAIGESVLRLAPPLVVRQEHVDEAVEILAKAAA